MKLTADFHTHTIYSDGDCTVAEQVARAKELGLKTIAITDHGFTHLAFGLRRSEKDKYIREIREEGKRQNYPVLVGIEGNILGREGTCCLREQDYSEFDVYLAGFHVLSRHEGLRDWFNGWRAYVRYNMGKKITGRHVKDQTLAYINTVKRNPVDVLTHVNYQSYADSVEVAKCCADYGTYLEISGKKSHFTDDELDKIVQTGVRFVVNSDAHSPERMGDIKLAEEQIMRVGVPLERIDNIDGRMPNFRLAEYKKRNL